jgi:pimeloyl-ACP methyl ester carboxylesterase
MPTLVMVGEDDAAHPPALAAGLAGAIPGARFARIPAAGHALPLESPEACAEAMETFLW